MPGKRPLSAGAAGSAAAGYVDAHQLVKPGGQRYQDGRLRPCDGDYRKDEEHHDSDVDDLIQGLFRRSPRNGPRVHAADQAHVRQFTSQRICHHDSPEAPIGSWSMRL